MTESNNNNVADFLIDLQSHSLEQYEVIAKLRKLILKSSPGIQECIKYGGILFEKDKHSICGLFSYKSHVSLELSNGYKLDDPYSVLSGKGKYRRHIKFINPAEIKDKKAEYYIKAAMSQT